MACPPSRDASRTRGRCHHHSSGPHVRCNAASAAVLHATDWSSGSCPIGRNGTFIWNCTAVTPSSCLSIAGASSHVLVARRQCACRCCHAASNPGRVRPQSGARHSMHRLTASAARSGPGHGSGTGVWHATHGHVSPHRRFSIQHQCSGIALVGAAVSIAVATRRQAQRLSHHHSMHGCRRAGGVDALCDWR